MEVCVKLTIKCILTQRFIFSHFNVSNKLFPILDLRQVPSDLSHFRRRIDDSIREQRKTREIVEEAQDKLRNLRQHQAEVEASLANSTPSTPRYHHSFDHHYYKSSRRRHYLHRSMSSLEEELNNKEDKSQFSTGDSSNRPSSSGGRLKGAYDKK